MSQQIDNQIVKMQFDNASFEKNVQQSMSTLDKLKQALHFDKVNMTPLQEAFTNAENTAAKAGFHLRDVWLKVGSIIEDQVANKIVNAGKKMVNALTMEGITDGFREYELKMGSIQTIMASTGESLATVNQYLDELNKYSDQTIYSFSDMTNSIGKFTNAGVSLNDAVAAIKGVANEAAISGANSNEASRAMYNFAQALSAGYVKLIDWKSIENANMATVGFKEALLDVATAVGTVEKESDGMYRILTTNAQGKVMNELVSGTRNFNDSLQQQWMTTEVLTNTLKIYATDVRSLTEAEREQYETELKNLGLNEEQIAYFEELGSKATDAASEVKTFSMLMDTLKEAIGSGWASTWQIIIGDFEQAKDLWTNVSKVVGGAIDAMSEARNSVLEKGLSTGWERFVNNENMAIPQSEKFKETLLEVAKAHGVLSEEQLKGIENTGDMIKSMHTLGWVTGDILTEAVDDYYNILKSMSKEDLDSIGITDLDIENLARVNRVMKMGGNYANDFAKAMTELGGRENVLQGLTNVFHSLLGILSPIRDAFRDVFTPLNPKSLLQLTKNFKEFTDKLKVSSEATDTLKTTFTLAFGAIKTVFTGVSTAVRGVLKLILPILNLFDAVFGLAGKVVAALTGSKGVLGAADKFSELGDKISGKYLKAMKKLADFINKVADAIRNLPESPVFEKVHEGVVNATEALKGYWEQFKNMPVIQQMAEDFWKVIDKIDKAVSPLLDKAGKGIEDLRKKIDKALSFETLNKILTTVYTKLKQFISLIKEFGNRIKNFFNGLKEGKSITESFRDTFGDIIDKIKELKQNIVDFFTELFSKGDELGGKFDLAKISEAIHTFASNITADQITMIAVAGSFMLITLNLLKLSNAIRDAVEAFTGIGVALKNVINSYMKKSKSTILQVAEAIVIVAAALWVLSTIPKDELENATTALQTVVGLLAVTVGILSIAGVVVNAKGGDMVKLASSLAIIAGAVMAVALSLKILEYVNLDGILPKLLVMGAVMTALSIVASIMSDMSKDDKVSTKGPITFIAVAGALYIAAMAMAKLGEVPTDSLKESIDAMLKIMVGMAALVYASGQVGVFSAVGLIVTVLALDKIMPIIERIVSYDYTKMQAGIQKNKEVLKQFAGLVLTMVAVGAIAGNRLKGAAVGILAMTGTFLAFLAIAKLAGMMDPRELEKGKSFLWSMAGLIALIEFCSKNAGVTKDLGKGFIRLSVAMGLMLGIAKLASMMKVKDLAKGIVATAALSVLVMGMAKAAKDCKGADGMVKAMAGMLFGISSILLLVTLLSFVNPKKMGIALGATLLVIEAIAHLASALTKNIQVTGENNKFSYGGLIVGLITVMALGALLAYLTSIPIQNVGAAAGAVIGVTLAVAAVGKALSKIHGQVDMNTVKSAVTALAFVAIISGVLFVFTKAIEQYHLNTNEMLKAAGAIAIVLVGITPALWAMSQFDSNAGNFEAMGKSIAAVILGMIAAAASIAVLSRCGGDSSKMIAAATAIAITLLALCAPIAVIGAVGEFAKNANPATMRATIIGAIGALVGVSAALFVLSKWGNVDNMAKAASAISIVLLAICVPIAVLGAVGQFAATAKPEVMVAAIAGAIIALIGVCWALQNFAANIDMEGVNEINAAMPSILAGVMAISILTVAIAAAGLLAGPATAGIGVVIAALGALAVLLVAMAGLGALLQNIDGLRDILITGLDFLVLVAGKLGEVIGSFVGGMAEGLTSHLEKIATDLENFSKHMVPFSENMSKVNSDAFDAVGSLVEAILLLTGASIIEGLTSWLGFGSGLDGLDFTTLGNAVVDFCTSISSIPGDAMSKANIAATVANKLAEMSSNIQAQGGLAGLIFGDKDLGNFGKDIAMFGAAIVGFIAAVKEGIPENAVDLAQRACDASIPMINLTKSLVSQGGFIKRFITGEKNLSDFSTQITNFASGLVTFIATLSAIEEISPDYSDMIKRCSDAVVPLVDLANGIKASGGVLQDFIGESTLDVFGSTLTPFAKYLKAFVIQLGLLYKTTPNANELIDKSVAGTQSLVDLSNKLPNIGGIKTIFTGKDDLDSFGKNLKGFGESLASYAGTITDVDMQTITDSATVLGSFISYAQAVKDVKSDAFKGLNDGLKNLSKMPISKISKEITDNTQTAIDAYDTLFTDLKDNVTTHETDDADTYKSYGKAVDAGIRDGILIDRYTEVCTNGLGKLVKSITDYLDLSMKSTKFETYGKNLVLGLQKGITDNQALAVDAAKGMATSTGAVVPKALKEHSPSRLTYGFGKFFSQGFANGINDYAGEAVNAATGMSDEIVNTANTIISSLARVIDSDIDMQPTIRPVLDTSNIEKGAGKLNRIFRNSDLSLAYVASGQIKEANNAKYAGQVSNNTTTSGEPSQISFVQNNYSPKALSRMEIYRQTKNQISMMKGVVANA